MKDLVFVIAGYGVILGGMVTYALLLLRRLGRARGGDDVAAIRPARPADDERG